MTFDTRIDGSPASIRANAEWLRTRLADRLDQCAGGMFAARNDASTEWRGDAGPAFTDRMDTVARGTDALRIDAETAARGLHRYADDLATAQAGMERARTIAREAGLTLAGTTVVHPGPTPTVPPLPTAGTTTPELVAAHHSAVAAHDDYQAKVNAYLLAKQEADRANGIMESAKAIGRNMLDDLRKKPVLVAGDFVNGAVGAGLRAHVGVLRKHSSALLDDAKLLSEHYLKTPGGSPQSKALNEQAFKRFLDADEVSRKATSISRRVGSKLPIIGAGVTVAGIGYDIHTGKPPGKAIISGVGGAGAAILAGAAFGAPAGPAGILVGAAVGTVVGLATSGALDWGYDQLPAGAKAAIEDGFAEVGNAIGDAGEAVGDNAKKVWNAIF